MASPNLNSSVLDIQGQNVVANIDFKVQETTIPITLSYPVSAILANAVSKGRTDWSVQDLLDLASIDIGLPVTANVTTL